MLIIRQTVISSSGSAKNAQSEKMLNASLFEYFYLILTIY